MKYSCLTVTQHSRIGLLRRSVWSFSEQTVPAQERELLLIHHDGIECTKAIRMLLDEYGVSGRILDIPRAPLGALRNASLAHARGELLCQWDDDDVFHPTRLAIQSEPFYNEETIATTLDMQMYWFPTRKELYIRRGGKEGIHGTIMLRNGYGIRYDGSFSKAEDSELIVRMQLAYGRHAIFRINDHPELYVRTYHGNNTWDFEHHYRRLTRQAISAEWLKEQEPIIRYWLAQLHIPSVMVRDGTTVAFST